MRSILREVAGAVLVAAFTALASAIVERYVSPPEPERIRKRRRKK